MFSKKNQKIYLLNEDMFYMNILQQHLFNLGYADISIFSDPIACLDNMYVPPHIIFYDYGIDFLKGLEVLKKIKRRNSDIYMIFICGPDEVETVIQSLKYGVFDYFVRGNDDGKNMENVITKIHRVKQLLKKNNIVRVTKFNSID